MAACLAVLTLCVTLAAPAPRADAAQAGAVRQVSFGTGALQYADAGQGGLPVVLVHGWACSGEFWKEQLGPVSAGRRVLVVDLPGHGGSASAGPFTQEAMAKAVLAVMDDAGVERAVLVGHSMGASVIRRVAVLAPQRAAGLVLVDGAILFPPADAAASASWREEMERFAAEFEGEQADATTASFINAMHAPATPQALKDWVLARMLATPVVVRHGAMQGFVQAALDPLPAVTAPTLAVYAASEDTPPNLEPLLRQLFPALEYHLLSGPGHFLMLEDPARFNTMLQAWLENAVR
ncbi:alpha/beta fold hydrolase [Megalodesulfovibrio gigas]|uniref:alpha/beta fold hydrolase n=1 Tax=Megalodesulfovibrio gigas TaxID=879 RepID=UPI00130DCBE0|nr:alpha/beta hydrolase [Megalodesulfovibrio gigas]